MNETRVSDYKQTADRVSLLCLIMNLLLSTGKLAAGVIGRSTAMVSDAVHSFSDAIGDTVAIIGIHFAEQKADTEHPYGHERLESVASVVIGVLLLFAGGSVGFSALQKIITKAYLVTDKPGRIALIAAAVSIIVKELMYQITMREANRLDSNALRAEAWHNRSDALSSVGALFGIFCARLGLPVLDPVAGFVISLFILRAAYRIFRDSFRKMVDHSCDLALEEEIRNCALRNEAVQEVDLLKTREFGRFIYVDMEISMDRKLSLEESHSIAHEVHDTLERTFPVIKHVMIHVNPC